MYWAIFLILSFFVLLGSVIGALVYGKRKYKSGSILKPSNIMFVGVIFSSVLLFIPIYTGTFSESQCGLFEAILISVHNMIRLFIVDGEFSFITSNLPDNLEWVERGYTVIFAVLFVMAPLLTFGFVLSFFKNASAYKRYITHFKTDAFIFSELNEKSLALATGLCNGGSEKRIFVFADVDKEDEQSSELAEKAKELGAICFKKDIVTVNFSFHSKKSQLNFFAIGEDQTVNVSQALDIISCGRYRGNVNLYVFTTQLEGEILLANASAQNEESGIRVRRVNEVRSLIVRTLYDSGKEKIFDSAFDNGSENKRINALIVGMGQHGTEMTKALSWLCQMDGYEVYISCFDMDPKAGSRFEALCPELMDDAHNNAFHVKGEAGYSIKITSGMDVDTKDFDDVMRTLQRPTYIFVALGNDEKNIATAIKLRSLFAQRRFYPEIQAIVYDSDKKEALAGVKNFKGQEYAIDFIGDMNTSYSEDVILDLEVENKALARHKKWGSESDFWRFDYNYKSSIASAIHYEMKKKCGIPGIEKHWSERTEDELWAIRRLEHRRWNAYMRSEGYVYGGTVDASGRNDLAKMHNCLVPFDELPLHEQEKDDD